MIRLLSIAVILLILGLGAAAAATPAKTAEREYAQGVDLFFKGKHAAALKHLKKSAALRPKEHPVIDAVIVLCEPDGTCPQMPEPEPRDYSVDASCLLGDYYALGLATRVNMGAAAKWWYLPVAEHDRLLAAAKKGDSAAQVALGDLYMTCPCDMHITPEVHGRLNNGRALIKKIAGDWYAAAFDAGDGMAGVKLGRMVERNSASTESERAAAMFMFQKAAEQGIAEGQYEYGLLLRRSGEKREGLAWLRKAEAQGYEPAIKYLETGRTNELDSKGHEGFVALLLLACSAAALFMFCKKKPLRAYITWPVLGKAAVCAAIFALALYSIGQTPFLSRIFDRLFLRLMQSRAYMPDALADNMYLFMMLFVILLVVFVLLFVFVIFVLFNIRLLGQGQQPADTEAAKEGSKGSE